MSSEPLPARLPEMALDDASARRLPLPAATRQLARVRWSVVGLVGLVASATCLAAIRAQGIGSPWIFPDELIYWDLARNLASTGHLAIRGATSAGHPPLYPVTLTPAFAGGDPVTAYAIAKWINALLFSLAAVPTYFLAQRLLERRWALLAAGFALLVPAAAYAGVVMSENLFYPVFICALVAIARAVERPTAGRQVAALAVIGAAYLTRAEAVVLVPILLTAAALLALSDGRAGFRRALRPWRTTVVTLATALAALLVAVVARGGSPRDLLGVYAGTAQRYSPVSVAKWTLYHLVDLELYVAVAPLLISVVVAAHLLRRRTEPRQARTVAALTVATTAWLLMLVGAVSSSIDPGLHDRYLFYATPLLFILFVHGIRVRAQLSRPQLAAVGLVCVALPLALPYGKVLGNASFEALALLPWNNTLLAKDDVPVAMALFAACFCALALVRRSTIVMLQVLLVAATLWLMTVFAHGQMATSADWVRSDYASDRAWIDHAVGNARVAVLWRREPDWSPRVMVKRADALWKSEFFNDRIVAFYALGRGMPYELPSTRSRLAGGVVVNSTTGSPASGYRYVLTTSSLPVDGRVVARDRRAGLVLYRVDGQIRLRSGA